MLEDVFRDRWGRVLATLVGALGDIELAEDAAQEAFALAAERWPCYGQPGNSTGWLVTTARNRAIDRTRRGRRSSRRPSSCNGSDATHPRNRRTRRRPSPTDEIARAFVVPFETMSKRRTRAKNEIRDGWTTGAIVRVDGGQTL